MMWDDHDICDGWGSNDVDDRPSREVIFRAARQAFIEFQMSHNPAGIDPTSFACAFSHQDQAFLLLDGRSHRLYRDGRVCGAPQLEIARRWLAAQPTTLDQLYLVLGIPPVHANAKVTSAFTHQAWLPIHKDFAADLRDGWTAPHNLAECAVLMEILVAFLDSHPRTEVTILAGDVHVGTVARLERCDAAGQPDPATAMWQIVSSGIGSPPPTGVIAMMLGTFTGSAMSLGAGISGQLHPVMERGRDVLLRRNFTILRPEEVSFFAEGLDDPLTIALPRRR
jgi:phosphodiesterase/alkaline phosphatase D-like protein